MTSILGISAFYHDSAACILNDGKIIAAAQEERFTRKKHDPDYPHNAIEFVLKYANLSLSALTSAVDQASKQKRSKNGKSKRMANPMLEFCLNELLNGSLVGNALTGMITCVSQHPRNGDETYLTLKFVKLFCTARNQFLWLKYL